MGCMCTCHGMLWTKRFMKLIADSMDRHGRSQGKVEQVLGRWLATLLP